MSRPIVTATDLFTLLKSATSELHLKTEKIAFGDLIKACELSYEQYTGLLICNFLIHSCLEKEIREALNDIPNAPLQSFFDNKSKWIVEDLQAVNVTIRPDECPSSGIRWSTTADLIGGMYVIEGSMLGGQYISRMLSTNLSLSALPISKFYTAYHKQTGKRWQSFRKMAAQLINTEEELHRAVETSKLTFQFFFRIYSQKLPI